MNEGNQLRLCITKSNSSKYEFADDHGYTELCSLRLVYIDDIKQHGLILSNKQASIGDIIAYDTSIVAVSTGLHANRICHHCFQPIQKKAVQREDYPHATYCSRDCLALSGDMIDLMAELYVSSTSQPSSDMFEITCMASLVIQATKANYLPLMRILRLYPGRVDMKDDMKSSIHACLDKLSPHMDKISSSLGLLFDMQHIMGIIRYNTQSIPILDLPSTQLLAIFPYFSRLNHSCNPTCIILPPDNSDRTTSYTSTDHNHDVDHDGNHHILGALKCIGSIDVGEDVCISYIQPLCMHVDERRELLMKAFHFHCCCRRCMYEEQINKSLSSHPIDLTSLLEQFTADFQDVFSATSSSSSTASSASLMMSRLSQVIDDSTSFLMLVTSYHHVIYMIYNAAVLGIRLLDHHIKASSSSSSTASQLQHTKLMMQLCSLVSQCWERCISRYHLQNSDYLSKGATAGVWLMKDPSVMTVSSSTSTSDMKDVIELGYSLAQASVSICHTLAPHSKRYQHMEQLHQGYMKLRAKT